MPSRSRIRFKPPIGGSRTQRFSPFETEAASYVSMSESIEDVTDQGDNQILTILRTERSGGLINGVEESTLTGYVWENFPCAYLYDSFTDSHLNISGQPDPGVLATSVIARTNPLRSETVSLEYVAELSDYGRKARNLFEKYTRNLHAYISPERFKTLRRAAKLNLLIQFGILPLISDIELLLVFQQAVDRRMEELNRLRTRGLRRTVACWEGSDSVTIPGAFIQSNGVQLYANVTKQTKVIVKGHIRWYTTLLFPMSDSEVRSLAKKALLGAQLSPSTLYEIMPWSWLIDYFTNLGQMVKAADNFTNVMHDPVRIMTHTRTVCESSAHSTDGTGDFTVTCTPFRVTHESKLRRLTTPEIGARIEMLQASQWSILGSLAVLRGL